MLFVRFSCFPPLFIPSSFTLAYFCALLFSSIQTKYKKSKSEASSVQSTLQKEITSLRDENRQLQFKLRHIEVANDDFERQARYTTSSLEDMESKYNQAIERGVLLEEEIRSGECEREQLRIESQRLKDQFADIQVETHILQEKLKKAEFSAKARARKASLAGERIPRMPMIPSSPTPSMNSNSTPTSSPKPPRLRSDSTSPPLPPSLSMPPRSPSPELPMFQAPMMNTALARAPRKPGGGSVRAASGPSFQRSSVRPNQRHPRNATQPTRAPPARANSSMMPGGRSSMLTAAINPSEGAGAEGNNHNNQRPGSLFQIKGLIGKMQRLEERVITARSRLPAPSESSSKRSVISPETSSILQSGSNASVIHRASLSQHKQPPRSAYASDSRPSSRTSRGSRASLSGRSSATSFNHSQSSLGQYDDKTMATSSKPSSKMTPPRSKIAVPRSVYSQSSSTTSSSPPASGIPTPKKFDNLGETY